VASEDSPIPPSVTADVAESISTALESWDPTSGGRLEEAEALRKQFVAQFPTEAWSDLPVESYALGQQTEGGTISWWMEFKTRMIASMSGGSSYKHLIFLRSRDQVWQYPKEYGSLQEAWAAVRSGFVEAFALASEGRFDEIANVTALRGAPALRAKLLYVYFPDALLPITSKAHVDHFLERLGQPTSNWSAVTANRQLLAPLRAVPALAELSTQQLGFFLYHWADPRPSVRVVKIAPGEKAAYWADCMAGGYICVGWDGVGDLSQYESKEAFRAAFRDHYPYNGNESQVSRKSNELWTLMELEAGDKVVANRGVSEVLAIGTVTEDGYAWRAERPEYRHTLTVEWDTSFARTIEPVKAWATTTVSKVSGSLLRQISGATTDDPITPVEVDGVYLEVEEALRRRGQVILYGPPGTGKTYTARRAAVWLLEGGSTSAQASALLADDAQMVLREGELSAGSTSGVRHLTRVTFHPSYTYEDFIEGFRPTSSTGAGLDLVLTDGVFKKICLAAAADPGHDYLLLIDEINRGNIPKIFGELITVIEKDKRGLAVRLPQSGDEFAVPPNVKIIGTMNTADRSIHLLDTALRRRFGFVELLPDPQVLSGATVGALALDVFLDKLNDRIRERVGREKQIGHALFYDGAELIDSAEAFAAVFRHELLPLLQEYLYEDYNELAAVLGPVIDTTTQRPSADVNDPETLCARLAEHFSAHAST